MRARSNSCATWTSSPTQGSLQNYLSDRAGSWVTVIIGSMFVVWVLAFRQVFVGELKAWQQRVRSR